MENAVLSESAFVDMVEEDLRNMLGYLHEKVKTLEEERKNDEELKRLKEIAKQYDDENYSDYIKDIKKNLAAARHVAKMRGIQFKVGDQ